MATGISVSQMERYRRSALDREAHDREAMAGRQERAWLAARKAAKVLKTEFEAKQVVVFGSLAHGLWFHPRSDIDLAVTGLSPAVFWEAWCALDRIGNEFEINLVARESAPPNLLEEIDRHGVNL